MSERAEHDEHDHDDVFDDDGRPGRAPHREDGWREQGYRRDGGRPQPVPAGPGLFTHALETSALVVAAALLIAWALPHAVQWQLVTLAMASVAAVTFYTAMRVTGSLFLSGYLLTWGLLLTAWLTWERFAGPWHEIVLAGLVIPALVLAPVGAVAVGHHREAVERDRRAEADRAGIMELRRWERKLAKHGAPGCTILDVRALDGGGTEVRGRLGKATDFRHPITYDTLAGIAPGIAVSERTDPDGAYFSRPPNGSAADFTLHVRPKRHGQRPDVHLPMENRPLTVTRPMGFGVFDSQREYRLTLREVCVLIIGVRDAGKSNLINVFLSNLAGCVDSVIWMIDMKGGRTARPWVIPYLQGFAARPVIDWVAVDRAGAKLMLETALAAGDHRARTDTSFEKIQPTADKPAIFIVCDDVSRLFGHNTVTRNEGEGKITNYGLATLGSQLVELYRSEAIDLIGAGQRLVNDLWGTTGIKSQAEVRFGLRVTDAAEGSRIFPDYPAAARLLAHLRDPGSAVVKDRDGVSAAIQLYRVGSEERIRNRALWAGDPDACLRPELEPDLQAALGPAYAERWTRPEIAGLLDIWRREANIAPEPEPEEEELGGEFGEIVARLKFDREKPVDPRRAKAREIVRESGIHGITVGRVLTRLEALGMTVARETVQRWFAEDESRYGLMRRGQHGSRLWHWVNFSSDDDDTPGKAM